MEKEKLDGIIENISYRNEDTGYCVLQVRSASDRFYLHTCVGTTSMMLRRGMNVTFEGAWTQHKRFGRQFGFEVCEITRPTTLEGITQLLESGLIHNIGAVRARMIVDRFGLETMAVLDNSPDRLSEIPGIGAKTLKKIKESWAEQRHVRDLVLFLQEYDITPAMVNRIYKVYGAESKRRICENPYSLIDDIWGIGFIRADAIAVRMGFDLQSYKRIKAGLTYALQEASSNGHTYLPRADLETAAAELLNVGNEHIVYTLDYCAENEFFIFEDGCVYLPYLYSAEKEVAQSLSAKAGIDGGREKFAVNDEEVNEFIDIYRQKTGWEGAPEQLEAVRQAAKNRVFILTGGPGTGKTTVLQVIVALFNQLKMKIELAAPTGRAAARMGSISGISARTIHRLLEFKPGEGPGGFKFLKCAENPIDTDVIILDEVSMIDILLMKSFLAAVKPETTLILVGDFNQLPSVGPGNVLSDLISCPRIPHVQLTRIFRQSAASRIVTAAHEIIGGDVPSFSNAAADNCFLITEDEPQKCLNTIVDLVNRRLPSRYGFDPMTDIQVLTPMHKGTLGTVSLNAALQAALNPNTDERKVCAGLYTFMTGDRVIQTKNNYDAGVFNGDIGFITAIANGKVSVTFDRTPVVYEDREMDQIIPAYCISIHKSQGSEFSAVVIPVSTQHYIMLQRNLIYTALTRAKNLCVLIGTRAALAIAVRNDKALTRNSRLRERISG
jgi:exodeoxyribonuclease V alpha subunit